MKRPRLNALRTFESAGRHLSFSNAGEELSISQAAVSQQIRQLEGHLDAKLFVRRNRGLSLTGVGAAYHLAVHEALDRLDAVTDRLFPGAEDHVVTLRCTPSVATLWLIPRLGQLHAALPGIELRVVTLASERSGYSPGPEDIEIATLDAGEVGPDCRVLMTALIAPVCAPSLLRKRRLTKPADLANFDLLHVFGYRDDWHRWFRSVGLSEQKVPGGVSFDGSLMALESAINGDGIMLGRRPFIDPHLQSGDLVLPFGEHHILTTSYFLRRRNSVRNRSDVNAVMDWLVEVASENPKPCN